MMSRVLVATIGPLSAESPGKDCTQRSLNQQKHHSVEQGDEAVSALVHVSDCETALQA